MSKKMQWFKNNIFGIISLFGGLIGVYLTLNMAVASNTKDIEVIKRETVPNIEYKIFQQQQQNDKDHVELKSSMNYLAQQTDKKLDKLEAYLIRIDNKLDRRVVSFEAPE